jgi:inner membrane protein
MTTQTFAACWFVAGIVLILAEFLIPYFVLIFFGISALITGALTLLGLPQQSALPYAVFAGVSLALVVMLRTLVMGRFKGLSSDVVNTQPGFDDIIGSHAKVITAFRTPDLRGRVFFRGTEWNAIAAGPLDPGEFVIIYAKDSHNLRIKKH